jgi:hypothetical protein
LVLPHFSPSPGLVVWPLDVARATASRALPSCAVLSQAARGPSPPIWILLEAGRARIGSGRDNPVRSGGSVNRMTARRGPPLLSCDPFLTFPLSRRCLLQLSPPALAPPCRRSDLRRRRPSSCATAIRHRRRQSSAITTVTAPRWGKDPFPPLFPLGFTSPRPRTLAGGPESRAAAAPPLRPPWPSPHPLDRFLVPPSLSPCWPYPEPRPETPRRASSGEPPPPPPHPAPPHRRSWPEPD